MALLLLAYAYFEPHQKAIKLVAHTEEEAAETLAAITLLKMAIAAGSSSHLPLVSGAFDGLDTIVNKAFEYAALANMILVGQLLILEVTKSWHFVLISLVPLIFLVFNRKSQLPGRVLLLCLMINPGLDIAVNFISLLHHGLGRPSTQKVRSHASHTRIEAQDLHDELSGNMISEEEVSNHPLLKHSKRHRSKDTTHRKHRHHGLRAKVSRLLGHTLHAVISAILFFLVLPVGYCLIVVKMARKLWSAEDTVRLEKGMMLVLVLGATVITLSSFGIKVPDQLTGITVPGQAVVNPEETGHKSEPVAKLNETIRPKLTAERGHGRDTLRGIDVSHHNGDIDWEAVKSEEIVFAYAKATQGTGFIDPKFQVNWAGMKKVGIARGAYHFYVANADPAEQAGLFISQLGEITKEDLPPMLDLEGNDIGGLSKRKYQSNVKKWLELVEQHYGRKPVIYTDHSFGNRYLTDKVFAEYQLWIAAYGPKPHVPRAWKTKGWIIWQHTPREKMAGINGMTDGDVLVGDPSPLFE